MPRRSKRAAVESVRAAVAPGPFVELLRPAAGRGLVFELECGGDVRLRVTLRDGGRWRLAGLEPPGT